MQKETGTCALYPVSFICMNILINLEQFSYHCAFCNLLCHILILLFSASSAFRMCVQGRAV